jgi:hypothetical protein
MPKAKVRVNSESLLKQLDIQPGTESRRKAHLFTEIKVDGKSIGIDAVGVRGCTPEDVVYERSRETAVVNLSCSLTYFHNANTELGPVTVVQDPRIENRGYIYLRRGQKNDFGLPGLSLFNQHLIFHVGDRFFYYPRAWQVVSALTAWPPEGHQYHHLEPDTPIFDFVTGEPNAARKGVSVIDIEGPLDDAEAKRLRAAMEKEHRLIMDLPGSKMAPEKATPAY